MAAQASEVDKRSSSASDMSNVQIDEEVSVPDVEVKHSPFQSQPNLRTGVLTSEEVKELGDKMRKEQAKKYFSLRVCTYYVWKILHTSIVFEDFERSLHVGKLKVCFKSMRETAFCSFWLHDLYPGFCCTKIPIKALCGVHLTLIWLWGVCRLSIAFLVGRFVAKVASSRRSYVHVWRTQSWIGLRIFWNDHMTDLTSYIFVHFEKHLSIFKCLDPDSLLNLDNFSAIEVLLVLLVLLAVMSLFIYNNDKWCYRPFMKDQV